MIHNHVPPTNRRNARKMRKALTDAELKLWNELRAHRLMNLGFRRQLPIAGYIVDFACPDRKLIVELDGSQHGEGAQADADTARDRRLQSLGPLTPFGLICHRLHWKFAPTPVQVISTKSVSA